MLELLKVSVVGMSILFGIAFVGNDCTLPNLSYEEEIVEEVVEPTEPVAEQKDKDVVYLEKIEAKLEGMNTIEIQQYLEKQDISYKFKQVNSYPYDTWCIIIPKGEHFIHIHWYDDRVEEVYMSIEAPGDCYCSHTYEIYGQ